MASYEISILTTWMSEKPKSSKKVATCRYYKFIAFAVLRTTVSTEKSSSDIHFLKTKSVKTRMS